MLISSFVRSALTFSLVAALAACTTTQDRGHSRGPAYPSYSGGYYGPAGVGGTGAKDLDPWLANTRTGQALILRRFDRNNNGEIGGDRAQQANDWFRRFADKDRDLRLTDAEIDAALADLSRVFRRGRI